jgi:uncharacterized protein (DUF1800 family)
VRVKTINKVDVQDEQGPEEALRAPVQTGAGLVAVALAAAACGGSNSSEEGSLAVRIRGGLANTPESPPASVTLTADESSRLLSQGTFGADRAEIERVAAMGTSAWLEEQFAMPRTESHFAWLQAQGYTNPDQHIFGQGFVEYSMWRKLLSSPDQLRQRMVYAMTQILVVSVQATEGWWPAYKLAYYLDQIEEHAFGNYRQLLEAVTLSQAMGEYLSMRGSRKADANGRQPDENYAREIMQLFSIGLVQLNADGTPTMVNNRTVPAYTEDDVKGLARVFTGWEEQPAVRENPAGWLDRPMRHLADRHETGSKTFLGITVPAGTSGTEGMRAALDALFNHANVGPFLGRQLIQRFVTSNPTPAYVSRVAAVFANNGSGVRGDLKAVLRAVLTDAEARNLTTARASNSSGKLREPVLRFAQWARVSKVSSPSGQWRLGDLSDPASRLGQSPLRSPSVFNFYRPGYVPPGTSIASASRVAPEFQITTETSVAGYLNFMQNVIGSTAGFNGSDLTADYSAWMAVADDPAVLAAQANLVLAAGQLALQRETLVRDAVASITVANDSDRRRRVQTALLLTLAAPDYLALK